MPQKDANELATDTNPEDLRVLKVHLKSVQEHLDQKNIHIKKIENELDILRGENKLLRNEYEKIKREKSGSSESAEELFKIRKSYEEYVDHMKKKQSSRVSEFISEIRQLSEERNVIFGELESAHATIQQLLRRAAEIPVNDSRGDSRSTEEELADDDASANTSISEFESSDLKQLQRKLLLSKKTLHDMDEHYKARLAESKDVIQAYQQKLADSAAALEGSQREVTELEEKAAQNEQLSKALIFVEQKRKILEQSYELLSEKFVDVNREFERYKDGSMYAVQKKEGEEDKATLSILQETIAEKDKELSTMRAQIDQLMRANAEKDRVLRAELKRQMLDDGVDPNKRIKITVTNFDD